MPRPGDVFKTTWEMHFLLLHRCHKKHMLTAQHILPFDLNAVCHQFASYCEAQRSKVPFWLTFSEPEFQKGRACFLPEIALLLSVTVYSTDVTSVETVRVLMYQPVLLIVALSGG